MQFNYFRDSINGLTFLITIVRFCDQSFLKIEPKIVIRLPIRIVFLNHLIDFYNELKITRLVTYSLTFYDSLLLLKLKLRALIWYLISKCTIYNHYYRLHHCTLNALPIAKKSFPPEASIYFDQTDLIILSESDTELMGLVDFVVIIW